MPGEIPISGRLVSAARALAGIGEADFAAAAGISTEDLRWIETNGSVWIEAAEDLEAVRGALDHFGVLVIGESEGMGAGVRLKFTRQDVRQIARLEGEGGVIGADDAP